MNQKERPEVMSSVYGRRPQHFPGSVPPYLTRAEWVKQARYWHQEWLRARREGAFYPTEYRDCRDIARVNARLTEN